MISGKSVALERAPDASPGWMEGRRFAIVVGSLNLGGAERQAVMLARHLADAGSLVTVWGLADPGGEAARLCEAGGIPWRHFPFRPPERRRDWAREFIAFARVLRRERPDVLLPYYMLANTMCGLVWRLTGAQTCVWNQRGGGVHCWRRVERIAARLTPCFVSNSTTGREFLNSEYGVQTDQIHLVPNGVEPPARRADRSSLRQAWKLPQSCFVACMVANLHEGKDHQTLIRAWRLVVHELRGRGKDALLLLAGRPDSTRKELQGLVDELRLDRTIRFLGTVTDVAGLLQCVDLCVFSSLREGCPNGVLEGMAAGLAVVGTDIAGLHDAVGPAGGACLAPPKDEVAFARHVVTLALDPQLRHRLGELNRERVLTEFAPERMAARMSEIIGSQLTRRGS